MPCCAHCSTRCSQPSPRCGAPAAVYAAIRQLNETRSGVTPPSRTIERIVSMASRGWPAAAYADRTRLKSSSLGAAAERSSTRFPSSGCTTRRIQRSASRGLPAREKAVTTCP
eukprot:scaffold71632_cov58-Phaeocystis_antarctica.AAC.3